MQRPSQQGQRGDQSGGLRDGPPQRREIKLPSSLLVRVERAYDDGWNTVSNNSQSNAKLDISKLRIPKVILFSVS